MKNSKTFRNFNYFYGIQLNNFEEITFERIEQIKTGPKNVIVEDSLRNIHLFRHCFSFCWASLGCSGQTPKMCILSKSTSAWMRLCPVMYLVRSKISEWNFEHEWSLSAGQYFRFHMLRFMKLNFILVLSCVCVPVVSRCLCNHIQKFILNNKNLILKNFFLLCPFSFLIKKKMTENKSGKKSRTDKIQTGSYGIFICVVESIQCAYAIVV